MQDSFTIPIDVNGVYQDFEFTDSLQGYFTVSLKGNSNVPNFRMSKDEAGQYKILADGRIPEWVYAIELQLNDNIELSKHCFYNKTISFVTLGNEVKGILDGSTKLWDFKSDNAYFVSLCPSGFIAKHTMYINPITKEVHDLYNKIYDEIDKILITRGADMTLVS